MRKITKRTVTSEKAISCDKCMDDNPDLEYVSVNVVGGYFSKHDGEEVSFDICENCVFELSQMMPNARIKK